MLQYEQWLKYYERKGCTMGQKMTTKEIRQIYFQEVKNNMFRRVGRTLFVLVVAVISVFLTDAATNQDLNNTNPNFRV